MPRLLAPSISSTSTSSPAGNALADVALVARLGRGAVHAVQGLGQDPRGRSLAHAASAGEQIGVADSVGADGPFQRPGNVLLAHQLAEGLRPVAAGDHDILAARELLGQQRVECLSS